MYFAYLLKIEFETMSNFVKIISWNFLVKYGSNPSICFEFQWNLFLERENGSIRVLIPFLSSFQKFSFGSQF